MTRDQIKQMVLDIIGQVDYDIAKFYDPETSEDWDYAQDKLEELIDIAEKYIKKDKKK